jgi:hypothetical protein
MAKMHDGAFKVRVAGKPGWKTHWRGGRLWTDVATTVEPGELDPAVLEQLGDDPYIEMRPVLAGPSSDGAKAAEDKAAADAKATKATKDKAAKAAEDKAAADAKATKATKDKAAKAAEDKAAADAKATKATKDKAAKAAKAAEVKAAKAAEAEEAGAAKSAAAPEANPPETPSADA